MESEPRNLPVTRRVALLVKALDGARRTNEALAACRDGEEMLDVLLNASAKLGLGLSRMELQNTPPIRDWVWWKNKEALFTVGDQKPRYQQDALGRATSADPASSADSSSTDGASAEGTGSDGQPSPRRRFLGLF